MLCCMQGPEVNEWYVGYDGVDIKPKIHEIYHYRAGILHQRYMDVFIQNINMH